MNDDQIWVNGIQVTDNCTGPLPQDLQAALDKLRSDQLNASGVNNRPTTPPTAASNRFFWDDFNNFFSNMQQKMAQMFAATSLAINAKLQSSSEFMKVVQDKVGPNVVIQSMVAKDGCIWINGIPIDKLIANSSRPKLLFNFFG